MSAGEDVVPGSELTDALKQIHELQCLLGKKTMEAEILKKPWRLPARENGSRARLCHLRTTSETGQ